MQQRTLANRPATLALVMTALGAAMAAGPAMASKSPLSQWISDGETSVSLRYRLESVEQDNALEDALASTLRTRIAVQSATLADTDLFLSTPEQGLEDLHARVSRSWQDLTLGLGWHDFRADTTDIEYGREWNLTASYRFSPLVTTQLKAARYRARQHAVDTDKIWFTINVAL